MVLSRNAETIVAPATPKGCGGVGIVRVSGSRVPEIAEAFLKKSLRPRVAEYLPFFNTEGEILDKGIALFFPKPHSFTGEDVLELQGHGGPVVIDLLIQEAIKLGARIAQPGEFSQRAFLNDKIDLLQAEAIAELIQARSIDAARSAMRSLQGNFSKLITELVEALIHVRVYVEASMDFSEEDLNLFSDGKIFDKLDDLLNSLDNIINKATQGLLLSNGIKIVLAGRPNAGKSSLLNALSGVDTAIVTEIPGTTRDILRSQILIDGLLIEVIDTAGLRASADLVEAEGIRRACKEIELADHLVLMVDGSEHDETDPLVLFPEWRDFFPKNVPITVLFNKIDKCKDLSPVLKCLQEYTLILASAKTGEGLHLFTDHLKKSAGFQNQEGVFVARRRHVDALESSKAHLMSAKKQLLNVTEIELVAEDLKAAQQSLEAITGRFTSDDLLGKIFSEFCIGK